MLRSLNLNTTPPERQQLWPINHPTVPLRPLAGVPDRAVLAAGAYQAQRVLPESCADEVAALLMAHAARDIVHTELRNQHRDPVHERAVALARRLVDTTV